MSRKKFLTAMAIAAAVLIFACGCGGKRDGETRDLYIISAAFDGDRTLTVRQQVRFTNRGEGEMRRVYFHIYPRAYEEDAQFKATDKISEYGSFELEEVVCDGTYETEGEDEDILAVIPTVPLLPGESASVSMRYTLVLPETDHRLGINRLGVASFGNWYPVLCAEGDTSPYYSVGDPFVSECADYEVSVSVPEELTVVMTGDERESDVEDGRKSVSGTALNVRDFAFLIGDFNKISAKTGKTDVSYYYISDNNAADSLSVAVAAVATYSRLFGEYPYEDYDVVQTLPGSGGMEYPRLSMVSAELNKSLYEEAIAHETAHQWWYGLVGSNQIEHAWLDEGLSEYSTSLFYERNPSFGVSFDARMSDAAASYVLYLDMTLEKTHSMSRRLPDFLSATDYAFISYVKGELFFHELRLLVGDDVFFAALKNYLKNNAYSIAHPDCLIAELEKASGRQLKSYCDGWINGGDVVAKQSYPQLWKSPVDKDA